MDVVDQMHALSIADRNGGKLYPDSDSYGSDSDAMSVQAASEPGAKGADIESTRGCSPAPSIYSFHSSVDGCAVRLARAAFRACTS